MQRLASRWTSLQSQISPYLPSHFGFKASVMAYALYSTQGLVTIISGPSMYPTLNSAPANPNSRFNVPDLVWLQTNYNPDDLREGDIVIFQSPLEKNFKYCKRIAALGDSFVYSTESPIPVYVPPGHFWALGDNPKNSWDSDQFGPVSQSLIDGIVALRLYPFSFKAVERKIMTNEVRYQDPVMLLQQQFEQYQKIKSQEVSFFENPIQYVSNWFSSGTSDDTAQQRGQARPSTASSQSQSTDMRTLNSSVHTQHITSLLPNKTSLPPQPNFSTNSQLSSPNPSPVVLPDGFVGINEHGDYLTEDDIIFNTFQREQAQNHLQLLLLESAGHKQIQQSLRHQQHREHFLKQSGRWHDNLDNHPTTQTPSNARIFFDTHQSTPTQSTSQQPANLDQLKDSKANLSNLTVDNLADFPVDCPTETYNPFTKRYGSTR